MLFLLRALSRLCRLCHLSLVPSWHTQCPFAACVTGSWELSRTLLRGLLVSPDSFCFSGTQAPATTWALEPPVWAVTHPDSKKHCLASMRVVWIKLILPYIVLCCALQPSLLCAACTSCRTGECLGPRKGCPVPVRKAELQPSILGALLVKNSRPLVSALPWDLHKARARSPAGDLSACVTAEGAKGAGCWWQCQGRWPPCKALPWGSAWAVNTANWHVLSRDDEQEG